MEIFNLGGPWAGDCGFEAAADSPAGLGRTGVADAGHRGFNVTECDAPGNVRHEAVERIARASAHRAQPIVPGLATERITIPVEPEIAPVDIALKAEDSLAYLVIVADRATHESSEPARRIGIAPAAAAVNAKVEAAPIVGLRIRQRLIRHRFSA